MSDEPLDRFLDLNLLDRNDARLSLVRLRLDHLSLVRMLRLLTSLRPPLLLDHHRLAIARLRLLLVLMTLVSGLNDSHSHRTSNRSLLLNVSRSNMNLTDLTNLTLLGRKDMTSWLELNCTL